MRKFILAFFVFAPILAFSQVAELDLMPSNMKKYIGKVTREQFEKIVGEPLDSIADGRVGIIGQEFMVYTVFNTYDKTQTPLRCYYRESDNILINVRFPTMVYLGYWVDFSRLPGFPGEKAPYFVVNESFYGKPTKISLKVKGFGCQISDIPLPKTKRASTISYHVVNTL